MKRLLSCLALFTLIACNPSQNHQTENETANANSPAVSETRDTVSSEPVAVYDLPLKNNLNNWHFTVKLFETKQLFHYLLDMKYQEVTASDTIRFPNFGLEPQPKIQRGSAETECIIGFLDKEKKFREYLKVYVDNEQLRVKQLKQYAVSEK